MGKFALITGGGGSVGSGLAIEFAKAGFDICVIGRTQSSLDATAARVMQQTSSSSSSSSSRRVVSIVCDVRDANALERAVNQAVDSLGQLSVVVHAAAVHQWRLIDRTTSSMIDEQIDTNLKAAIHLSRAVAPHLIRYQSGCIIFISSWMINQLGWPGYTGYVSSKFGIVGVARSVFEDLRNHNIKVSTLYPGYIRSEGLGGQLKSELGDYLAIESDEMIQPEDIATTALYVANTTSTACPTDIYLQPMRQAVMELNLFVYRGEIPIRRTVDTSKRVVFLTGASRGVGRATAVRLAARGWDLALVARGKDALEETADMCRKHGVRVACYSLDVGKFADLEAAVHQCVVDLGNLNVMIANAGVNRRRSSFISSGDVWDQTMDVNLRSVMHQTRVSLPYMQQNPTSTVIFVSSVVVVQPGSGGSSTYYASKYGLLGFAACVFEDARSRGVKVSCICPGLINNEMGTKGGPTSFLPPEDLIQNEDVSQCIEYVMDAPTRLCPTRIILFPQKEVIGSLNRMHAECKSYEQQQQQQQQQPKAKL